MAAGLVEQGQQEAVGRHYTLVESWRGAGKVLRPERRVLAVWRAWAGDHQNVTFIVKRLRRPRSGRPNPLEQMRAEVRAQAEGLATEGRGEGREEGRGGVPPSRRVVRRGSSLKGRRKGDTLHPRLVELLHCRQREVMALRAELESGVRPAAAREDILKPLPRAPVVRAPPRHKPRAGDTSEDSGVVTDDSEARSFYENTRHWRPPPQSEEAKPCAPEQAGPGPEGVAGMEDERPGILLEPPPCDEWFAVLERLESVNRELVGREEELVALEVELEMVEGGQPDPGPLLCFTGEVAAQRDTNAHLLQQISHNRQALEAGAGRAGAGQRAVQLLQSDLRLVEREGERLQRSLASLATLTLQPGSTV